jgi:LmbE family N-acetylglucosaminyl deacetylase
MAVGATLTALVEAGGEAIVCTVFAGAPEPPFSPVAEAFHADCGLGADAVECRQAEDAEAAQIIGASVVHLPFLDAIYRRQGDTWLCPADRSMFDVTLPDEPDLRASVTTAIASLVRQTRPTAVWTCGAIGDHVDHRLTRTAVVDAARSEGCTPVLWEGIPYAMGLPPPDVFPLAVVDVRDDHLERKLTAIAHYASQIRMLWPDDKNWCQQFLDHARSRRPYGAPELLWHAA